MVAQDRDRGTGQGSAGGPGYVGPARGLHLPEQGRQPAPDGGVRQQVQRERRRRHPAEGPQGDGRVHRDHRLGGVGLHQGRRGRQARPERHPGEHPRGQQAGQRVPPREELPGGRGEGLGRAPALREGGAPHRLGHPGQEHPRRVAELQHAAPRPRGLPIAEPDLFAGSADGAEADHQRPLEAHHLRRWQALHRVREGQGPRGRVRQSESHCGRRHTRYRARAGAAVAALRAQSTPSTPHSAGRARTRARCLRHSRRCPATDPSGHDNIHRRNVCRGL